MPLLFDLLARANEVAHFHRLRCCLSCASSLSLLLLLRVAAWCACFGGFWLGCAFSLAAFFLALVSCFLTRVFGSRRGLLPRGGSRASAGRRSFYACLARFPYAISRVSGFPETRRRLEGWVGLALVANLSCYHAQALQVGVLSDRAR